MNLTNLLQLLQLIGTAAGALREAGETIQWAAGVVAQAHAEGRDVTPEELAEAEERVQAKLVQLRRKAESRANPSSQA